MLRQVFMIPLLLLCMFKANAQEQNTFKLAIETGPLLFSEADNLSAFIALEPQLKVAKNMYMGLRVGLVLNPQKFDNHDPQRFEVNKEYDNGGGVFAPTLSYFFEERSCRNFAFRPYLGLGAGAYLLTTYVDVISTSPLDEFEVKVNKQAGMLFRAGVESKRLRFGLEYNLIQQADINIPNGETVATVNNSYFGLAFGFTFGTSTSRPRKQ